MKKIFVLFAVVLSSMVAATSASAARQTGLVNINVEDNVVQVPVAVAANVCNVSIAAVLAVVAEGGSTTCDAFATNETEATITPADPSDRETRQRGLINVNIQDNIIQVPIAVAANLCDIDIALLAAAVLELPNAETDCTATAGSQANA